MSVINSINNIQSTPNSKDNSADSVINSSLENHGNSLTTDTGFSLTDTSLSETLPNGRLLSPNEIPSDRIDLILREFTDEVQVKTNQNNIDPTLSSVQLFAKTQSTPFDQIEDQSLELLGPSSTTPQRKLQWGFFKDIGKAISNVAQAVSSTVSNVGQGIYDFFNPNQGRNNNDNNDNQQPSGAPPATIIPSTKTTTIPPNWLTPRIPGVDFFSTYTDRNFSLSLFGIPIDVIATYQQNLNMTNFMPDPNYLDQTKFYAVRDNPSNMMNFTSSISSGTDGINFFNTAMNTYFTLEETDLISMLFDISNSQFGSFGDFDPVVVGLMETSSPKRIADFLTDYNAVYKPFNKQIPLVHINQEFPRELSRDDVQNFLAIFLILIFASIGF